MQELIRIATRQSQLALWQANFIRDELLRCFPNVEVELVGMTTKGDKWLQASLAEVGGKGLFVKELEAAMLAGKADMAVHSVKDMPAVMDAAFSLPVLAYREDVRDVLVGSRDGLDALADGAIVGSSSLRRKAQLLAARPDLDVRPIRGNVDTRLKKLDDGEFDAIVLAQAGLNRLALARPDTQALDTGFCLPAPGQGALGIQCPAEHPLATQLAPLADPGCARCVRAERGVSAGLGGDCSLPIAALATLSEGDPNTAEITLTTRLASADGKQILHAECRGTDPEQVSRQAVEALYTQGAGALLATLRA